jgi:hypothetical protein
LKKPVLERFFERTLDMDRYLRYLAATTLVSHWDSVARNVYWCLDTAGAKRWLAIPWDADRTWGDHEEGGWLVPMQPSFLGTRDRPLHEHGRDGWNKIRDRVLAVPALRARYEGTLAEAVASVLRPEVLSREIDQALAAIEPDALRDRERWPLVASKVDERVVAMTFTRGHFRRAGESLKLHVAKRAAFLGRAPAERKPKSAGERRAAARRELVAVAFLSTGVTVYAFLLLLVRRVS